MACILAAVGAGFASAAGAEPGGYDDTFFGISWEMDARPGAGFDVSRLEPLSLSLVGTLGNAKLLPFLPLRARFGFGFWPQQGVSLRGGVEIAVLEVLSDYRGRSFGLYVFCDGILRFAAAGVSADALAVAAVQVPLGGAGALSAGAGVDARGEISVQIRYTVGAYLLEK